MKKILTTFSSLSKVRQQLDSDCLFQLKNIYQFCIKNGITDEFLTIAGLYAFGFNAQEGLKYFSTNRIF